MRHRTLRPHLAGLAALALATGLTACGTTDTSASAQDEPTAAASADCTGEEDPGSSEPVTLTDSWGRTVELDAPAERVAVLEWQMVEDVLSLCLTPVAVADPEGYRLWDTAEELPEDVVDTGTRGEPDLSTLFGTDPDLVIVETYSAEDEIIAQLEEYDVPVLATKGADAADPIQTMLDTFTLIAEATGRTERAELVVEEFETAVEEQREALDVDSLETDEFVYFDGYVTGGNLAIRPFGQGSLIGELGEELGLVNAWEGEVDPAYGLGSTDLEGLSEVGDAHLLYTGTEDPEYDFATQLTENRIWSTLPAVEEGRAAAFPPGIWTFGGPRSAIQALEAFVETLG